jgi:hypothetical protein
MDLNLFFYNQVGIEFVFQKPVNLSDFKKAVEKSLKKGLKGKLDRSKQIYFLNTITDA